MAGQVSTCSMKEEVRSNNDLAGDILDFPDSPGRDCPVDSTGRKVQGNSNSWRLSVDPGHRGGAHGCGCVLLAGNHCNHRTAECCIVPGFTDHRPSQRVL